MARDFYEFRPFRSYTKKAGILLYAMPVASCNRTNF